MVQPSRIHRRCELCSQQEECEYINFTWMCDHCRVMDERRRSK